MWFLPLDRNVWQKVYSVPGISIKYLTYMIYFIHHYYLDLFIYLCVCARAHVCVCVSACARLIVWRSEDNRWGWFLPSVVWVLAIELSLLGLAASSLTNCPRHSLKSHKTRVSIEEPSRSDGPAGMSVRDCLDYQLISLRDPNPLWVVSWPL